MLPLALDLLEDDPFVLSEYLAGAKLLRLLGHAFANLGVGPRSKRCRTLGELGCERINFG